MPDTGHYMDGKMPVHSMDGIMPTVLSEWEEVLTLDLVVKNISVRE